MSIEFARYLNVRSATAPALSPDGRRVAFLSDISGNLQVWSASVDPKPGEWPSQLTFFADKVWEVHAAPQQPHLIAVGDVGGNERQQFYLVSGYGGDDDSHTIRRLTQDDRAIHRFGAWRSDGRAIVYTSNARNGVDFDTYQMDVESGEAEMVHVGAGNRTVAAWSPDGSQLLIVEAVSTLDNQLNLLDLAQRQERNISGHLPPARYQQFQWTSAGLFALTDLTHDRFALCRIDLEGGEPTLIIDADFAGEVGELELVTIDGPGKRAAVTLNVEGYSQLYLVGITDRTWARVTALPKGVITKLGKGSGLLALDLAAPERNSDIWLVEMDGGAARQATFSDRAGLDARTFVKPELIHFTTFDQRQIPAFFYRPQSEAPAGGYPCILYVHGGPAGQQRPDFDVRFQFFLNQGYALLVTNVRGSTGYGRQYTMLDDVDLRLDSVADLKHAVLWLHDRPEIAAERIAIYGRSYGGYMVLAALTEYPDLFAAGIDVVGIANWVTFLERTSAWRRAHREREYGSLSHDRALLERLSPIHKAERIAAPLLVVAGDNDPRVPLHESEQIVQKVSQGGGTVEFLHYADEGHKISKLHNRIDSFSKMAEFLDRHLAPR